MTYEINSLSKKKDTVAKVYGYVGASLLAATAGAYLGSHIVYMILGLRYWLLIGLEFAFLLTLLYMKKAQGENPLAIFLLFGFTFTSGVVLGPTIAMLLTSTAGISVLINSLLTTSIAVVSLSFFAFNTKKDFTVYYQMAFIALIGLIVVSIVNLFIHNTLLQMAIAYFSLLLFSFYLIMDTQRMLKGAYRSPIIMATNIYIDILNIFLALIQIFSGNRK